MELFHQSVPVKLSYDEYDSPAESGKPPIIFLHGLLQNRKSFEEAIVLLCKKTERKIYALDLRGHGSSPYSKEYNIFSLAADVRLFIEEKQIKKLSFVCNSFSCRVAAIIANYQPGLIEKLVFTEIFPYSKDDKRMKYSVKLYEKMTHFLKLCHSMEDIEPTIEKFSCLISTGDVSIDLHKKQMLKIVAPDENGGIRLKFDMDLCDSLFDGKFTLEPLAIHTGPALYIYGEAGMDILKDKDDPSLEIYFPNVEIVGISGGTHLLIAEKTKEFVAVIEKFLSE